MSKQVLHEISWKHKRADKYHSIPPALGAQISAVVPPLLCSARHEWLSGWDQTGSSTVSLVLPTDTVVTAWTREHDVLPSAFGRRPGTLQLRSPAIHGRIVCDFGVSVVVRLTFDWCHWWSVSYYLKMITQLSSTCSSIFCLQLVADMTSLSFFIMKHMFIKKKNL